jgi:hypothetical protein
MYAFVQFDQAILVISFINPDLNFLHLLLQHRLVGNRPADHLGYLNRSEFLHFFRVDLPYWQYAHAVAGLGGPWFASFGGWLCFLADYHWLLVVHHVRAAGPPLDYVRNTSGHQVVLLHIITDNSRHICIAISYKCRKNDNFQGIRAVPLKIRQIPGKGSALPSSARLRPAVHNRRGASPSAADNPPSALQPSLDRAPLAAPLPESPIRPCKAQPPPQSLPAFPGQIEISAV